MDDVIEYDLVIVGAGSGNTVLPEDLDERVAQGYRVAIVESDRFGGTCLNRGCIPSKMFVVAADVATSARTAARLGVDARLDGVDWPAIRDRVFGRIDPIHEKGVAFRRRHGVEVYLTDAEFVGPRMLMVGDQRIRGEQVLVASGSRPTIPPIDGLDDVPYYTSDDVMRAESLPTSMIVVGGGFIAAEMGHVFSSFGTDVTVVQRGPVLLPAEDAAVAERYTNLAQQRFDVRLSSQLVAVEATGRGVRGFVEGPDGHRHTVEAEALLIAAGRTPNSDLLKVEAAGVEVDDEGHLVRDPYGRATAEGVWTLGDVSNHFQLKHMANAEARVVAHNLFVATSESDLRELPEGPAPHAVFGSPQVASIGITEREAQDREVEHVVSVREYSHTAYGWALEDETSFVKIVADPTNRTILGAHIIGPQASLLIQPLVQAMALGNTVDQVARDVIYLHPALSEVVEQALLELGPRPEWPAGAYD